MDAINYEMKSAHLIFDSSGKIVHYSSVFEWTNQNIPSCLTDLPVILPSSGFHFLFNEEWILTGKYCIVDFFLERFLALLITGRAMLLLLQQQWNDNLPV